MESNPYGQFPTSARTAIPAPNPVDTFMTGPTASRPVAAPPHLNWIYFDTDKRTLYQCTYESGFAWVQVAPAQGAVTNLFDHFADASSTSTGGTEDDLYSDTVAAGQLTTNGDKITASYSFSIVASGTASRQIRGYFGGTLVMDSTAFTWASGGTLWADISLIRESSSVVRVQSNQTFSALGKQALPLYTRITGLTLSNTQILKVTGTATGTGAASGDIVAKLGNVLYRSAA